MSDLIVALGLVLVIEGLLWSLFPGLGRRLLEATAGLPPALTQTQRACVQKVIIEVEAEISDPYPDKPNLHSFVRSGVTIRNRWIASNF